MDAAPSHDPRVQELTREIATCAQRKQLPGAVVAFDTLVSEGHAPNVFAFCALVNAHCACADMPGALSVCARMVAVGVQPNTVVLTTLIKGFINAGETERAHALLAEMTTDLAAPGSDAPGEGGSGKPGLWACCARVRPDTRAVNALLRGCVRTGHVALANSVYEQMVDDWHVEADVTTFKLMVKLHAMALDGDAVAAIAERLAPAAGGTGGGGGGWGGGGEGGLGEEEEEDAPGGPLCMFWREGQNSCPRGSLCKFRHPATILQLGGAGKRPTRSGADGGGEGEEGEGGGQGGGGGGARGRAAFLCELRLQAAHAYALVARWDEAMASLALAERWHAAAVEESKAREAEGGEDGNSWYAQLALGEAKRELNRIGSHVRSGLARAKRPPSSISGGGLLPDTRGALCRTFLLPAATSTAPVAAAAASRKRARASDGDGGKQGDALSQSLFDTLRRAFGLDTACAGPSPAADERAEKGGKAKRRKAEALASQLQLFAARYAKCVGGSSAVFKMRHVFAGADGCRGTDLPLCVEVCSGNGDWAVAQAAATLGSFNWLAAELRYDRVWQILSRVLTGKVANLALVGGNAHALLGRHLRPGSVSHVFVNFPEPPHHSGDANAESAVELLSPAFFKSAHAALAPILKGGEGGGRLTILSDSRTYSLTLARLLGALHGEAGAPLFASTHTLLAHLKGGGIDQDWAGAREDSGGVAVHHGVPGRAQGHHVRVASYFDRFWEQGQHVERYFIDVTRLPA
ncbi:hypothetical protein T492DRAFT_1139101 [Pavlovales sp. CCMP2436]|nr:hypothetical protein T492DRAFT_1139101 [Pavlovales sp. CCMP2436]